MACFKDQEVLMDDLRMRESLTARAEIKLALHTSTRLKGLVEAGVIGFEKALETVGYLDQLDPYLESIIAKMPYDFLYVAKLGGLRLRNYPDPDKKIPNTPLYDLNAALLRGDVRLLVDNKKYDIVLDKMVLWQDWLASLRYDALIFRHFGRTIQDLESDIVYTTAATLAEELIVYQFEVPEYIKQVLGDAGITEILSTQEALSRLNPEQSLFIDEMIAKTVGMDILFPDEDELAGDKAALQLIVSELSDLPRLAAMILNSQGLKDLIGAA